MEVLPSMINDFEKYLQEQEEENSKENYQAGGLVMNYGDYGRSYK